ncbi:MAG: TspO/MBR family protein [Arhodomonas sp.]|nr:TspO/MBR family protein [Arhodomonas sp.]
MTAAAAASGAPTPPGEWYAALSKPPGTPPAWVFPVAWTLLYVMMAVAAWLVGRRVTLETGLPVLLPFIAQLGANGLWSVLFFGWQRPVMALLDLLVLWGLVVLCIHRFRRVSVPAAALLLPYLLWISFAAYLNAGIVVLNPL